MAKKEKGLVAVIAQAFAGYNPDDQNNAGIPLQSGPGASSSWHNSAPEAEEGRDPTTDSDWVGDKVMPEDRYLKYDVLQGMITDPLLSGGIDLHICHALSADNRTGNIVTIEATDPSMAELAAELNAALGPLINEGAPSWCKQMAVFGAHYVRPYAREGVGIVDIESSWYTMARQIREYVRGGKVAGYTSEYLKKRGTGGAIQLAEPWSLVALKIPYWQPNINREPLNNTGTQYSLYDDNHRRVPIETQDYGTSMLEHCYPAWCDLKDSLVSLKGSRYNASRIDRFVALGMENLDPVQAAQYLNLVGTQMRKDLETAERKSRQKGLLPTVWNRIVPALAGGKGGVTIDTQTTSPDIAHIEDVMFHLKRMSAGLGLDVSMLGWGDLMSGGLGDGGFFRTSIHAAIRANWLRIGLRHSINRMIDIHMANKFGKVFPAGQARPIEVKFHSLNTAIAQEEADERESRANFAMTLATLLDTIENGRLAGSDTFKNLALTDLAGIDKDVAKAVIHELAKSASDAADSDEFMESVGYRGDRAGFDAWLSQKINSEIISFVGGAS